MNNSPATGATNNTTRSQQPADTNSVEGRAPARGNGNSRPQAPIAATVGALGTHVARLGVRFSNTAHGHEQVQIRTYVPSQAVTHENIATRNGEEHLAVVLRELLTTTPLTDVGPIWREALPRSSLSLPRMPTRAPETMDASMFQKMDENNSKPPSRS